MWSFMTCGKPGIGYAQFREMTGNLPSPEIPAGVLGSQKSENQDIDTGSCSSPTARRKHSIKSKDPSVFKGCTLNPPDPLLPRLMYEKRRPEMEKDSNLGRNHSVGIVRLTGIELKNWRKAVQSMKSQATYSFVITEPLPLLQVIMSKLSESKSLSLFITVQLEPAKVAERGMRRDFLHTLRIRVANFGVATAVMSMLLSMNLEEELISAICLDGWIDILSELKLKEVRGP